MKTRNGRKQTKYEEKEKRRAEQLKNGKKTRGRKPKRNLKLVLSNIYREEKR